MKKVAFLVSVLFGLLAGFTSSAFAQAGAQTNPEQTGVILLVHPQDNEMSVARGKLIETPMCKLTGFVRKDGKMYLTIATQDKQPATVQKVKDHVKQNFAAPELIEASYDEVQKLRAQK